MLRPLRQGRLGFHHHWCGLPVLPHPGAYPLPRQRRGDVLPDGHAALYVHFRLPGWARLSEKRGRGQAGLPGQPLRAADVQPHRARLRRPERQHLRLRQSHVQVHRRHQPDIPCEVQLVHQLRESRGHDELRPQGVQRGLRELQFHDRHRRLHADQAGVQRNLRRKEMLCQQRLRSCRILEPYQRLARLRHRRRPVAGVLLRSSAGRRHRRQHGRQGQRDARRLQCPQHEQRNESQQPHGAGRLPDRPAQRQRQPPRRMRQRHPVRLRHCRRFHRQADLLSSGNPEHQRPRNLRPAETGQFVV